VFQSRTPGAQFQTDRGVCISGPAPHHATRNSFATFRDPDGNGWLFQEVTAPLPRRGLSNSDVATLTELCEAPRSITASTKATAPKHTGQASTPPTRRVIST
jgi:hypothetical protein